MLVKEYPTVLKEEEKLTVKLEDMGMGRKKKLGSGSDISKEERIACEEAQGLCANLLVAVSLLLVFATLPLSLCFVIKVVQEYERAVIFRLGLLLSGGARGPGVFFVIPCVDMYQKIDMRTQTYDVPPQEVALIK